jgi:hypothetical protein
MELSELPLTGLVVVFFALLAITIFLKGLKMPPNHKNNEHIRSIIRKQLFLNQQIENRQKNNEIDDKKN